MSSEPIQSPSAERAPPPSTVRRDLGCVAAVTVLAAVLGAAFDLSEKFYRFTRGMERFQLDELPGTLLVLSIAMAWFAWRRYRDARRGKAPDRKPGRADPAADRAVRR